MVGKIITFILAAAFSFRIDMPPPPKGVTSLYNPSTVATEPHFASLEQCHMHTSIPSSSYIQHRRPKLLLHNPSGPHLGLPAATQTSGCPRMSELLPQSHSESRPSWSRHGPPTGADFVPTKGHLEPTKGHLSKSGTDQGACCPPMSESVHDSHSESPLSSDTKKH